MTDPVISFRNVGKTFTGRRAVAAIADLSFDVGRGDYVCIVGPTGCGKSTTINLLLGIERPSRGSVSVLGLDPFARFNQLRGTIGCIFQSDRLLPWRTAIDNVRVPIEIIGRREDALKESPHRLLQRLGLAGFEQAYPHELSGGMRQRVGIARALASDPAVLLADEAFGHLDEVTASRLRTEFRQVARDGRKTVLHVTHSIDEAIALGDRILVFGRPGRIVADLRLDDDSRVSRRDDVRREIYSAIAASHPDSTDGSLKHAAA